MKNKRALALKTALLLAASALLPLQAEQPIELGAPEIIAHRTNPRGGESPTMGSTAASSAIYYHNSAPVLATPTVYVIWYGNWNQGNGTDTPAGQQIVRDFLASIGGSPYFNINKSYSTPSIMVTGSVTVGPETSDPGSRGNRLADSDILAIVRSAINSGRLGAADPNGVYFVLTSSNIAEKSGFCTRYCGWHTHGSAGIQDIQYSFVGNAARCLNGCAAQSVSPNGNPGVDGMISVIAHELEEATSDPDLNAWFDSSGAENADKCAWTFGHSQDQDANGASYNITLTTPVTKVTRNYLIQRNLYHNYSDATSPLGDYCGIAISGGTLIK